MVEWWWEGILPNPVFTLIHSSLELRPSAKRTCLQRTSCHLVDAIAFVVASPTTWWNCIGHSLMAFGCDMFLALGVRAMKVLHHVYEFIPSSTKTTPVLVNHPRQLYHRVQPWFMEQKPNQEEWAQVVYALARSGRAMAKMWPWNTMKGSVCCRGNWDILRSLSQVGINWNFKQWLRDRKTQQDSTAKIDNG